MNIKKIIKRIPHNSLPALLCILAACVLVYSINLRFRANGIGTDLGTNAGTLTGKAIGSMQGLLKGRDEGTTAGQQEALANQDTQTVIEAKVKELANLEVLVASVKLSNFHTIGDTIDYAALYLVNGNVVFSVDFSKADISEQSGILCIKLPTPTGKLYLDNSTVQKAAEYQKRYFSGNAEAGFDAYINAMRETQVATEKTLSNYDALFNEAKSAAEKQVRSLIEAMSVTYHASKIEWIDESGDAS